MDLSKRITLAKRVYLIGNGGSYANAIHIANDLLGCGIRAYTLDPASLTRSANDHGYEYVFADWLDVVGERGDLLIALSGSGKSKNILRAIATAKKLGMDTELITWHLKDGMDMQASEEVQISLGHEWMRQIRGRR